MNSRETPKPEEEPEVTGDEDVADVDDAETNPDLEDPRLYSPLLAQDEPCLERRRSESAAAGRSMIPCADEEADDTASGTESTEAAPTDGDEAAESGPEE